MAIWKLSNYHKKNAVEKQFWTKDGKVIIREEGYRWGTWTCESDERPDVDLANPDGWEPYSDDVEWEFEELMDGCWAETTAGNDKATEEDIEEFEEAWDENYFEGVEKLGWSLDDTEFSLHGPLQLENEDTGETWNGEDDAEESPTLSDAEISEMVRVIEFPEEQPVVTDWFPVNVNPTRPGRYETSDGDFATTWPFPFYADWDGDRWSESDVKFWRGLAEDPGK